MRTLSNIRPAVLVILFASLTFAATEAIAQIEGPTTVCHNSQYSYDAPGGSGWSWQVLSGGSIVGSSTGFSVTVLWSSAGSNRQLKLTYYPGEMMLMGGDPGSINGESKSISGDSVETKGIGQLVLGDSVTTNLLPPGQSTTLTLNVNVISSAIGGTASGSATFCTTGSGTVSVTGYTGTIIWQSRVGSGSWTDITGATSSSYAYSGITTTTDFRAKVQYAACSFVNYSTIVTITINPGNAGTISETITTNTCGSRIGTFTLSGYSGTIQYWEMLVPGETVWWVLDDQSSSTLPYNLNSELFASGTYQYRAKVKRSTCATLTTAPVSFYFQVSPEAGTVTTPQTRFFTSAAGTLTATGTANGNLQWYSKPAGSGTWTLITGATSATYNFSCTQSTDYQLRVTGTTAPCNGTTVSSNITITILNPGTISGAASTEEGEQYSSGVEGSNGEVKTWEVSYDNGVTWKTDPSQVAYFEYVTPNPIFYAYPAQNFQLRARVYDPTGHVYGYTPAKSVTLLPFSGNTVIATLPNHAVKRTVLETAEVTLANVATLNNVQKDEIIEYVDGLGRTRQQIAIQGSPLAKDMVQVAAYDAKGYSTKNFLPYTAATTTGSLHTSAITEQAAFYASPPAGVVQDAFPFAFTSIESSPFARVTEQGAPGQAWQPGSGHTVRIVNRLNDANEVRLWKADGTTTSYYDINTLYVAEVTDENGSKSVRYTDKSGRAVLTKTEAASGVWLLTYTIYDALGRAKYVVQPEGVNQLGSGTSLTLTQGFINDWVFAFTYDSLGRLTEKKVPGSAAQYYVYNNLDRIVLAQDGNLRASNQWTYIKYDRTGRPVVSGIYTNATQITRASVQALVNASTTYFESRTNANYSTQLGYTNAAFPTASAEMLTVSYYDDYDFDFNSTHTADATYQASGLSPEPVPFLAVRNLPTGAKVKILGTSTWLTHVVFYDNYGRVIQAQSGHHLGGSAVTTTQYDFSGRILQRKNVHSATAGTVTLKDRYVYDHASRLTKVYQTINTDSEVLLAGYEYNELGQVARKRLHSTNGGSTYLQDVDYAYTIRGWLKSINDPAALGSTKYFGMELLYNDALASGLSQTPAYNGNISAVQWKNNFTNGVTTDTKAYAFTYDKANRLTAATYGAGSGWTQQANHYSMSNLTYDGNGNMLSLTRKQPDPLTGASATMDNLAYTYATGNTLTKVEDASTSTAGFSNGSTATTEYAYDAAGNLKEDKNKGISSMVYNVLGKVSTINFTDGRKLEYTYDAAGNKLTMKIYSTGSVLQSTTDYASGFVYENAALAFFGAPEGRVVKNGSTFDRQYALTDHQGNTRVVFSSTTPAPVVKTATMEAATNSDFQNYTNRFSFELMDHTDVSGSAYSYAQKLTGGNNSQVGVARSMKVSPGDKVKIEAYGKYYNPTGSSSNLTGFAAALTSAFNVSASSSGEALKAFNALNDYGAFIAGGGSEDNGTHPRVYVNILLFDKDYNFVDAAWDQIDGGEQIGTTPKAAHDYMSKEVTVTEAGYAFVYVSHEEPTLVDFYVDDVTVTHTPTNIIQAADYYPFGLQTASSWTRENAVNNFLYNQGTELNNISGLYETMFRGYDAALGRFMQVDPLAHIQARFTPYHYALNNPILFNDPNGDRIPIYQIVNARTNGSDASWTWDIDFSNPYTVFSGSGGSFGGGGSNGNYGNPAGGYTTTDREEIANILQGIQDGSITIGDEYIYYGGIYTAEQAQQNGYPLAEGETSYIYGGYIKMEQNNEENIGDSDSENDFPFNSAGLALNIGGAGFTVLKSEYKTLLNEFTKTAIKTKAVTGKLLGVVGFALTAYQFGSKLADPSQTLNSNDYMDFGVGVGTFVAGLMVVNPVGLAVVVGVGIGYGLYTIWRDNGE